MSVYLIDDTSCFDPWHNLAVEESLLERCGPDDVMMYLWQNAHTIVIGRHQNPWRECRCEQLEQEGGKLARRITGGGAVFHDLGNLNFSFIAGAGLYDLTRQLSVILRAVESLGMRPAFSGRNDILVDGRKFSGNAFAHKTNASLHHGTLLVCADMPMLGRYLQVSTAKMESKGIKSVRSRVANLTEFNPEVTITSLREALRDAFEDEYDGFREIAAEELVDPEFYAQAHTRQQSWDWRYGQTPRFDITLETRFPWGGVELLMTARDGRVAEAKVYSDAMDPTFIDCLEQALVGSPYTRDGLCASLHAMACPEADDLADWVAESTAL